MVIQDMSCTREKSPPYLRKAFVAIRGSFFTPPGSTTSPGIPSMSTTAQTFL